MSDRFDFLHILSRKPKAGGVNTTYPAKTTRVGLIRRDVETGLFGASVGGFVFLVFAYRGSGLRDALFLAGLALFGVLAYVYGMSVLARAVPDTKRVVYNFTAPSAPTVEPDEPDEPDAEDENAGGPSFEDRWRLALYLYLLGGKRAGGFSIRDMTEAKFDAAGRLVHRKYMSNTTWRRIDPVMKRNGVLAPYADGTDYAAGLNYRTAVMKVTRGEIKLPEYEPPKRVLLWEERPLRA